MEKELLDTLDSQFVVEMFSCAMSSRTIMEVIVDNVKDNFLPEQHEKDVLKEMRMQFKAEGRMPTFGTLKLAFRKERDIMVYIDEIKECDDIPEDTMISNLEKFIRQSRFIALQDEIVDMYNKGDKNKAYSKFINEAEKLNNFTLTADIFEPIFGNFNKRNTKRAADAANNIVTKIPLGIDELDYHTKGGGKLGEVICYLAASKGGKSFALTHHGLHAARLGYGVAHFQLEGTALQCWGRYDSSWTGTKYSDIENSDISQEKYKAIEKTLRNLGKGDIHVYAPERFNFMTMVEIRRKVRELKKKHDIKVVIIDYIDLCSPDDDVYTPKDERFRQQKTVQMMKQLAMEEQVLVITATQASSISKALLDDQEFVINREHLAEDKGKIRPVDMLITINRTAWEAKNKICRLYLDGLREHGGGEVIYIRQSLDYSKFYHRKLTLDKPVTEEDYEDAPTTDKKSNNKKKTKKEDNGESFDDEPEEPLVNKGKVLS